MKLFPKNISSFDKQLFYFGVAFVALFTIEPIVIMATYETPIMLLPLLRYLFLCFSLGIGFVYAFLHFWGKIYTYVVAVMMVLALYSLKLSFYSAVSNFGYIFFLGFFVSATILVSLGINKMREKCIRISASAYILTAFIALMSPAQMLFFGSDQSAIGPPVDGDIPEFKDKPNIYLISYDSLVTEDPTAAALGIPSLPYQPLFDKEFHVLNKGISFHIPSRQSIGNIMRLGQKSMELDLRSFSGNSSSYLEQVARSNGYHLVNGYVGLYFGSAGPFVDESLIPDYALIERSVLCFSYEGVEKLRLFGLCVVAHQLKKFQLNTLYKLVFSSETRIKITSFHERLLEMIKRSVKSEKPVMSFTYTYSPIGHTSGQYNHENLDNREKYRNAFVNRADNLKDELTEILEIIKKDDPDALVVVFGDHGPYLSRKVKAKDDPEFFYKDRHGVLVAVAKTQHPCAKRFESYRTETYNTTARAVTEIFACLSGERFRVEDNSFDEDPEIANHILKN